MKLSLKLGSTFHDHGFETNSPSHAVFQKVARTTMDPPNPTHRPTQPLQGSQVYFRGFGLLLGVSLRYVSSSPRFSEVSRYECTPAVFEPWFILPRGENHINDDHPTINDYILLAVAFCFVLFSLSFSHALCLFTVFSY